MRLNIAAILVWPVLVAVLICSGCQTEGTLSKDEALRKVRTAADNSAVDDAQVVAVVNGDNVYLAEVRANLERALKQSPHSQGGGDSLRHQLIEAAMQEIITERMIAQAAVKEGIDREADFRRRVELQVSQDLGARYYDHLKKEGEKEVDVSEKEIDREFEPSSERWAFRVFFSEDRAGAEEVRSRALQGEDFTALVISKSQGLSAQKGGELGYIPKVQLSQVIHGYDEALLKLKSGELSPVLDVGIGFAVYKLEDIKKLSAEEARETRRKIADDLRTRKAQEKLKSLFEKIVREFPVRANREYFSGESLPQGYQLAPLPEKILARVGPTDLYVRDLRAMNPDLFEPEKRKGLTSYLNVVASYIGLYHQGKKSGFLTQEDVEEATRQVSRKALVSLMQDRLFSERVKIDDTDAKKYYGQARKDYVSPKSYDLTMIMVSDQKTAKSLKKQVVLGMDMGTLVETYSEEKKSGRIQGKIRIPLEEKPKNILDQTILTLKVGEIADPVLFEGKYYLLRLDAVNPKRQIPFEEVKEKILRKLRKSESEHVFGRFLREQRKIATIQIYRNVLDSL